MTPGLLPDRGLPARVKVCGLTRLADARLAFDLGASALGFIFHPNSPRFLRPLQARELRRQLPTEALCVGVFVDVPAEDVNALADYVGLDAVQLHGREPLPDVLACRRPVLKAIRPENEVELEVHPAALLLVDAERPGQPGGTGQRADWTFARRVAARRPLLLAGGLAPDNVAEALDSVCPFALDLNSGVESAPGVKDSARLAALFEALRACTPNPAP